MSRRFVLTLGLAALIVGLAPGIASASVTGDCTGSAEIQGVTYTPANDTPATAIPIPNEDGVTVKYSGSVGFKNTNHHGSVRVQVASFGIKVGDWAGTNEKDERGVKDQIYELDGFRSSLPVWIPGIWRVSATHSADGGSCSGFALIRLEGNPLGSAVGWIVLALALGSLALLAQAVRKRRLALAIVAGLLLGLFFSVMLMMYAIRPLDSLSVYGSMLLFAIIGIVGVWLVRRRSTIA